MAYIKDYYTDAGQHFIQVTPQESGWIGYQAAMICKQKPEWLPPCEALTETEGVLYEVSDCICIQNYSTMEPKELDKVAQACARLSENAREFLLDPGGFQSELRYIYWDTKAERLQCIYVPQETETDEKRWRMRVLGHLLSHAIVKTWPEDGVLQCYRLYRDVADEGKERKEESKEKQEEQSQEKAESMIEYQARQARYARYALWDDMAEEEEEEPVKETVQKVKDRMRQFFSRKEK